MLNISALFGTLTGIAYLIYYGWAVVWWAPIAIFVTGLIASIFGLLIERIVGSLVISLVGFIGWPVSAYFMFSHIPHAV